MMIILLDLKVSVFTANEEYIKSNLYEINQVNKVREVSQTEEVKLSVESDKKSFLSWQKIEKTEQ